MQTPLGKKEKENEKEKKEIQGLQNCEKYQSQIPNKLGQSPLTSALILCDSGGVIVNWVLLYADRQLKFFPSSQIQTLMNRVQSSKATDLREILM